jgi:hypothetical protein
MPMTAQRRQPARWLAACCAILTVGAALASCASGPGPGGSPATASGSPGTASGSPATASGSPATPSGGHGNNEAGGHVKTFGIVRFAMPPAGQGCAGAHRLAGGGTSIPVTVSARHAQVAALANVCIDGKGPFPFLIDTGAQGSVLTASLATKLRLPKIGQPVLIGGAGCSARAQISRISSWNAAGLALRPQYVTYLKIPLFGGRGEPDGLLGSDVWGRFGAMRLDFARGTVTVPGPERPAPAAKTTISGPSGTPVPASLLRGKPAVVAPMTVTSQLGSTGITVKIRLGTHAAMDFTPDSGASQSAVDTGVARQTGLASANARIRQSTVCTVAAFPELRTGPWSVAGHPLRPQVVGATGLVRTTGVAGLLGADQMSRFGSVIFDYAGGRLVLGAG